jgi:1-pyrroline-5-carboxylate dehydrogenase
MYVPASLWPAISTELITICSDAKMGDVTDPSNFINAVIDENSFNNCMEYIQYAMDSDEAEIIAGGKGDKSIGYFVEPTIIVTTNSHFRSMEEEIFGPVLTVFIYEDEKLEETVALCNNTSPYGLTGSDLCEQLRYAAGNFYINDKPTGAIVGLQPFGGSRASGTNDKAGGEFNLIRWISPRTIKETFLPATEYRYPYMIE